MADQHCPGFESNKQLNEVKVVCPECKAEVEIFADELNKSLKCPKCSKMFDPKPASRNASANNFRTVLCTVFMLKGGGHVDCQHFAG